VLIASSLPEAVALLSTAPLADTVERIFVIGGAAAFAEALSGSSGVVVDTLHLTRVHADVPCDVFIPPVDDAAYALTSLEPRRRDAEDGPEYQFLTFKNRRLHGLARSARPSGLLPPARHEEHQYLDAIR
jgi:dihydrofolate reductase